jgi:hypothetical protein
MEDPSISADKIGFPKGLTSSAIKNGRKQLESFAEDTLKRLVEAEKLAYGCTPSIALFCRMDIGVMPKDDGGLGYFVNEVTRCPTKTCKWTGSAPDTEIIPYNLAADFSLIFSDYLRSESH